MAKRIKVERYVGIYYRIIDARTGNGTEKEFYITYRRGGRETKVIEEPVGHTSDGMTPAKANIIRADRIAGKELNNQELREQNKKVNRIGKGILTIKRLWQIYDDEHPQRPSRRTDLTFIQRLDIFMNREPHTLQTRDITTLRNRLENTTSRRKQNGKTVKLSPQTIKNVLELLRRILRYADRQGLSPFPSGLVFEMPTVDNQRTENMTVEQMKRYLEAIDEDKDRLGAAYLSLIMLTGIRKNAALALRWDDINFETGVIILRGEEAKNGKTERLPLSPNALGVIASIPHVGDYLFPGKNGGHREAFRHIAEHVKKKAGLPENFRPIHGLRHTYTSTFASSGQVTMYELQKLLTHGSPQMTQRYAHLADEVLRKAASIMVRPHKNDHSLEE